MSIWFQTPEPSGPASGSDRYLAPHLGIEFTEVGDDYVKGTMPVDERTMMPMGLLHGGASCVLAETLASYASFMCVNPERFRVVGLEINANHLRGVSDGRVTGVCRPYRLGRSSHVWGIEIFDDRHRLICVSRMTTAVIPLKTD